MQLSGQKPVPDLMPISLAKGNSSSKCSRKDSRKVYDESTNTECACEVCGKQWPAKKHLWQHLIRFHRAEAAVTCGVCLKLCQTYEDLAKHLKEAHESTLTGEGNNFTCKTCGRYHNARSKLLLHMSIHINYNGSKWCQNCHQGFEDAEKLTEHMEHCTVKQVEFEDHSNDIDASERNDNDNDDKGSLIDDDNSLMEEVEEVEFESEAEGDVTDNHEDSNSDNSESEASNDSISDEEENDDENEEVEEDDVDEENDVDDESRTHSRVTGDVSTDSQSEDEDSEHHDDDLSEHSDNDQNDKEIKDTSIMRGTDDKNVRVNEDYEDEDRKGKDKIVKVAESPDNRIVDSKIYKKERAERGDSQENDNQSHDEAEFEEKPCELQNQALLKEEPGDYLDDEGPPVLSPMVPLPVENNEEDQDSGQMDTVEHKFSPMVSMPPSIEEPAIEYEMENIKNEIEKGESSQSASIQSMEIEDSAQMVRDQDAAANTLTEILESDSDHDKEKGHQDEDETVEDEEKASDNEEKGFDNDEKVSDNEEKVSEDEEKGFDNDEKASDNEENGSDNEEKASGDEEQTSDVEQVTENEDDIVEEEEEAEADEEEEDVDEVEDEEEQTENDHHEENMLENCDEEQDESYEEIENVVDISDEVFEENSNGEIEDMEVDDETNTVEIPTLDGTVLMVANDADGNQILIQRNVSDLPNDDSNPEVTEYILEDENEYQIGNYDLGSIDEDATHHEQSDDSPENSEDENNVESAENVELSTISAKSNVSRT